MKKPTLCFGNQGLFKILQLTDLHTVGLDGRDATTMALVEKLICDHAPDLAVFTGDIVGSGPRCVLFMDHINAIMEKTETPYTFAYGNHESNGKTGKPLSDALEAYPLSLYERGDKVLPGFGNYAVDVDSKQGHCWTIYHFFCNGRDTYTDSKGERVKMEQHINTAQQSWFLHTHAEIKAKRGTNPSLVFGHKPLPEHDDVWMYDGIYGDRRERVKKPFINTGFFSAMANAGDVRGYFCGHDHANSYQGEMFGITLGYGRHTGYHCACAQEFPRGGRIIVISDRSGMIEDTYIALHSGEIIKGRYAPPIFKRSEFYIK